jgi:hypothetical protein
MSLQAVSTVRSIRQSTPARSWSDGRDAIHTAVRELRKHHPRAGEQQIAHLLTEQLEVDGELLEAVAIYLAHDAMTAERVRRVRSAPTPQPKYGYLGHGHRPAPASKRMPPSTISTRPSQFAFSPNPAPGLRGSRVIGSAGFIAVSRGTAEALFRLASLSRPRQIG